MYVCVCLARYKLVKEKKISAVVNLKEIQNLDTRNASLLILELLYIFVME